MTGPPAAHPSQICWRTRRRRFTTVLTVAQRRAAWFATVNDPLQPFLGGGKTRTRVPSIGKLSDSKFRLTILAPVPVIFLPPAVLSVRGDFASRSDGSTAIDMRVGPSLRGLVSTLVVGLLSWLLLSGVIAFSGLTEEFSTTANTVIWVAGVALSVALQLGRHLVYWRAALEQDDPARLLRDIFEAKELDDPDRAVPPSANPSHRTE